VRPAGDGLVGVVFEALHELHFLNDVREGARFVGRVLEEKMKPSIALVHLYDINSRHFVVMSAMGSRREVLLEYATPDDDPLAAEIMKSDEAILVVDPASDPRLARGRWRLAEPKKSVLCAGASIDGRYLGLLEIADPVDGSEFSEEDRNVLTYIATAFAKYLDGKGIVLGGDPELDSAMAW
jgi:GAF domain-containing protein